MTKRMIIMLVAVGLILGGVFGFLAFKQHMIKKYMSSMGAPAQTVSTTKATLLEWQSELRGVGSIRAVKGVDISSELAGSIEEIRFDSGDNVKQGDLLVKLRADDDIARLRMLEAKAKLAEITYNRDLVQLKVQAVSQATVDADTANLANAKAELDAQQALVDKKHIRAPFSGTLGIRAVDVGQYLEPGAVMVTLQQLDHLYLDFSLPEQAIAQLRTGQKIIARTDSFKDKLFTGKIIAINPKVDPASRNIQVRATLDNPEKLLLPGMYATATIKAGKPQNYVTLPQTTLSYNPYGNTVYLVDSKGKNDKGEPQLIARQSFVKTGQTRGDQIAILSGVKEGEEVVSSGQIKLQNGTPIIINNSIVPSNDENPEPKDE